MIIVGVVVVFLAAVLMTESQWQGDVTEAAAGPLAQKAGVEQAQVLPWKIDGDLLLFFFLAGGAVAGFAAGYYWRVLFAKPGQKQESD